MPPAPFSPVKFSGLIERVLAEDRRDSLPMSMPSPENPCVIVTSHAMGGYFRPLVLIDSMICRWKMTNSTSIGAATIVEAAMM